MSKKELRTPVYYLVVAGVTLLQAAGMGLVYSVMNVSDSAESLIGSLIALLVGISAIGFVDQLLDEFRDQLGLPARKTLRPVPDAVRDSPVPIPTRSIWPTILLAIFFEMQYIYAVDEEAAKTLLDTFLGGVWLLVLESLWLKYMLEKGIVRRVFSDDK